VPACEVVVRDDLPDREAADETAERPDATAAEQIGASDTGEGEPVIYDRIENEGTADAGAPREAEAGTAGGTGTATDTLMAESAADAEAGALVLDEISEHHAGPGSSVADEPLIFANSGDRELDLSGWSVVNDEGRSFTFPEGLTLAPGERVTLHSGGSGGNQDPGDEEVGEGRAVDGTDLHWGPRSRSGTEQGDTVTVVTPDDHVVLREPYRGG
jgi:competence protein ComEC